MNNKTKPYCFTQASLTELQRTLSPERFSTCLRATGHSREKAIRLYVWNTSISAAFYGPLQSLEIALRNAMHDRLSEKYGTDWYDNSASGLNEKHLERLEDAKSKLQKENHTPPRIVAELSLGFWVSLLSRSYDSSLWHPVLHKVFPHATAITRRQAHKPLIKLLILRNRIAHHEPIFSYPLRERCQDILEVIGWISPHKKGWTAAHSRVEEILDMRQDSPAARFC